MRFTTVSGAVYQVRDSHLRRLGPFSPGIDYDSVPDDTWTRIEGHSPVEVGQSVYFNLASGMYRVTTPVVSIDDEKED